MTLREELVAVLDDLVRADHEVEVVVFQKLRHDVGPERIRNPAFRLGPALRARVGVRPEEVAYQTQETALLQARRRKTEQLKSDRLARERREAQSKRDEAARARQNQRFARKQAAREHDSRLVAALAERSKAALKRCQAAEKKVRACARAAKLAAGDARYIEGLVRDARRRAPPPPAVTPAAA